MRRGSMLVAIAWALLVASPVDAEIYKWVDEKGNVHYGDCPPPDALLAKYPSPLRPQRRLFEKRRRGLSG